MLWSNYRLLLDDGKHPFDRRRWNLWLLVLVLVNSVLLPLDLCLQFGLTDSITPRPIEYCIDAFFVVDIVLNLRTTWRIADSAEVITDGRLVGVRRLWLVASG